MPSDLSEKIKAINAGKPVATPYHPELPKEKKEEKKEKKEKKEEIKEEPVVFAPSYPEKKVIKNDWQQPAMFYIDFILKVSVAILALATLWYVIRLICIL